MSRAREAGGVSLFVVIFTALLITIITVGFTRFVIGYQQQAQRNDLSERAYNSALAGVEDAKRVLVAYTKECAAGTPACTSLRNAIDADNCDTITRAGVTEGDNVDAGNNAEKQVGDPEDNQAYTCVKIALNTDDYNGSVDNNGSSTVHLKGVSNFNRVHVTWFTKDDSGDTNNSVQLYDANPTGLPPASDWPTVAPPILRTQYIPTNVDNNDLDDEARTAFLYPSSAATANVDLGDDNRRATGAVTLSPALAACQPSYGSVGGVCTATLVLPSSTSDAYLQLSALYNATSYKVELLNGANVVQFNGVSPQVDATGRAADLFRRVSAQVEIGGAPLPAPIAALFTTGNLCKDFTLRDTDNAYNAGSCEP